MAYFQRQQGTGPENSFSPDGWGSRSDSAVGFDRGEGFPDEDEDYRDEDDGFDALLEDEYGDEADPESGMDEEEFRAERSRKLRIAAGAGDLTAVLVGVAVILLLTALLISMIQFVSTDMSKNFFMWMTKI